MPKHSAFLKRTKQLSIVDPDAPNDPDSTLHVMYRPHAFTPAIEEQVEQVRESQGDLQAFYRQLCELIESWDLLDDGKYDEHGNEIEPSQPIKITPDNLHNLSSYLLIHVVQKIGEDIRPDPTKSLNSAPTLQVVEGTVIHQNGQLPSTPLAGQG